VERTPRLYRRRRSEGGILLGLCAGLGAHLGIDPLVVRLALVLMVVMNVAGLSVILVYLLFALFVPYEPDAGAGT
jgi:phage shock protein PspC (stress-responsive transcriptional regulator)